MSKMNNIPPALRPLHPGEILRTELKARKLALDVFAERIGMQPSRLNDLVKGKIPVTIDIAEKLQDVLGIDSQSWINLQAQYDNDLKTIKKWMM